MKKILLLLLTTTFFLSACAKKIDGTNMESLEASAEEIEKSLDSEKQKEFKEAMKLIGSTTLAELTEKGDEKSIFSTIRKKVDGKTADEIIAEGKKLKKEKREKEKDKAKEEVEKLYQAKENLAESKKKLAQFKISDAYLFTTTDELGIIKEPAIEMTVKNGTDKAISKGAFLGTITSPDRSVPWIKETFVYDISGGIEQGETATWTLKLGMFNNWGNVNAPSDATLKVEATRLYGANGELLYSAEAFSQYEQKRLDELLKTYPEFKK